MKGGDHDCKNGQPRAARHADRRREPDDRRGCQPADTVPAHKDQAAADEADAGDDLRRDTRRVENNPAVGQNVSEAIF
jgi:hypothetical protein